jgi:hypothetical protein
MQYLDFIKQTIHENLKNVAHAPSVQMQNIPESAFDADQLVSDEVSPDICQDNALMSSERFEKESYLKK